MFLFLILAVPAWIYTVVSLYPRPARGWRGLIVPLLLGFVAGVLCLTVTLGLLSRIPFGAEMGRAFSWAWWRGPGWMLTVVSAGLITYYYFKPTSYSRIRELSLWLGGAALAYIIWYAVTPESGFDGYRLFVAPLIWLSSLSLEVWLVDRGLRSDGWISWLFYTASVLIPTVLTFLPVMYLFLPGVITISVSLVLLAGSMVLIYLDSRGRLS